METIESTMTIESTIEAYFDALGRSDSEAVAELFTEDGALMADEEGTMVGRDAMRQALSGMFQALSVQVAETYFDHVREEGDVGVARTRTVDHIKLLAANTEISVEFRELFVMRKTPDGWRIADYIFNRLSRPTG